VWHVNTSKTDVNRSHDSPLRTFLSRFCAVLWLKENKKRSPGVGDLFLENPCD
jgi:hypothetical protein